MKPKTIREILSDEGAIELVEYELSDALRKQGVNPNVYPRITAKALAQIQQLLEECLPEPTTALDGNEAQIFIMATDQYKSNLMERVK